MFLIIITFFWCFGEVGEVANQINTCITKRSHYLGILRLVRLDGLAQYESDIMREFIFVY